MKDLKYPQLLAAFVALDLPIPTQEVVFAKELGRKWRTDFTIIQGTKKIAIEIEGGAFSGGRHTRGVGFVNDMQKYNAYSLLGYTLLRFTSEQAIKQPIMCAKWIKCVLEGTIDKELIAIVRKKRK
jgi:very-short-patch-repair endonuclease